MNKKKKTVKAKKVPHRKARVSKSQAAGRELLSDIQKVGRTLRRRVKRAL